MQTSLSHRCHLKKTVVLFVVYCVIEKKTQCSVCSTLKHCLFFSSLELRQNYIFALQRHAGQILQAITLGHMRSNDYSTAEIFVDNFLLSTLSIMSTNRFSPTVIPHNQRYQYLSIRTNLVHRKLPAITPLGIEPSIDGTVFPNLHLFLWIVFAHLTDMADHLAELLIGVNMFFDFHGVAFGQWLG